MKNRTRKDTVSHRVARRVARGKIGLLRSSRPERLNSGLASTCATAGDRIRTDDVQLGKLTFYH